MTLSDSQAESHWSSQEPWKGGDPPSHPCNSQRCMVMLFLPPMIPGSQHGGKADLGDLCSGVVSTELRLCPETHTYRGKQNYMNKSLLSKRALVNLSF